MQGLNDEDLYLQGVSAFGALASADLSFKVEHCVDYASKEKVKCANQSVTSRYWNQRGNKPALFGMIQSFEQPDMQEHQKFKFNLLDALEDSAVRAKTHIKMARNDVETYELWGERKQVQTFVTVESKATEQIFDNKLVFGTETSPDFTKVISLADVRYVVNSRQASFVEMLGRFWGIVLTLGLLTATIVQTYSYFDL